jgi:hypothetical protein
MWREEKPWLCLPIGRKASENIWSIGQNVFDSCFSAAGHKEIGDKICTILLAGSCRSWVPIGVDAWDANQLAEKVGGGHRFCCLRYQSMNFGMPSDILTRG